MSAEYSKKLFEIEQQLQGVTASDIEVVEDIIDELYNAVPHTCNAQLDAGLVYIEGSHTIQDEQWKHNTRYELNYWREPSGELCSELQLTVHDIILDRVDDVKGLAGISTTYRLGRKGTIPTSARIATSDLRYTKTGIVQISAFDSDEYENRTREMNQFDVNDLVQLLLAQLDMSMSSGTSRA